MRRALSGQTAIVTGGSSGIGRAIGQALAAMGVRVAIVSRCRSHVDAAVAAWPASAPDPVALVANLAEDGAAEQIAGEARERLGSVHLLVHSAGVVELGPFADLPVRALDEQYRLNVRAPFVLTQQLLPSLLEARGQIVFVNSSAGLAARAGVSQYAASKHALKALADSLREEVRGRGVRVLSVFPGRTATPMQEAVRRMEGRPYDASECLRPEDVAAVVIDALTLPETAEVKDISIRPGTDGKQGSEVLRQSRTGGFDR